MNDLAPLVKKFRKMVPEMNLVLVSNNNTVQGRAAIDSALNSLNKQQVKIIYIASEPDPEREFFKQTLNFYQSLGVDSVEYFDLEDEFKEDFIEKISNYDVVHLSGGDTYRFLYWLKKRKLVKTIQRFAEKGGTLIGVSAGAMILTPSIDSAKICGDINSIGLDDTTALNLVPFMFSPHAKNCEQEVKLVSNMCNPKKLAVVLCRDSDAIVFSEKGGITEIGDPIWIANK